MRILVAVRDDDRVQGLVKILRQRLHYVALVRSAVAARRAVETESPDCLVTELNLFRGTHEDDGRKWPRLRWRGPTVMMTPDDRLAQIVAEIEGVPLRERTDQAAPAAPPPEAPPHHVVVFDPTGVTGSLLDVRLVRLGWMVSRVGTVSSLTKLIISSRSSVDCVVVAPTRSGTAPRRLIRAMATVRDCHPRPFVLVGLVDRNDPSVVARAVDAGANRVAVRRTLEDVEAAVQAAVQPSSAAGT